MAVSKNQPMRPAEIDIIDNISTVETGISNEALARQNADSALQTNIDNEAFARRNADTTLQTNINNEIQARQNAVGNVQLNLDSETIAREDADLALQGSITSLQTEIANLQMIPRDNESILVTANSSESVNVTFTSGRFDNAPFVFFSKIGNDGNVYITSVSEVGFTIVAENDTAADITINVAWLAIEALS